MPSRAAAESSQSAQPRAAALFQSQVVYSTTRPHAGQSRAEKRKARAQQRQQEAQAQPKLSGHSHSDSGASSSGGVSDAGTEGESGQSELGSEDGQQMGEGETSVMEGAAGGSGRASLRHRLLSQLGASGSGGGSASGSEGGGESEESDSVGGDDDSGRKSGSGSESGSWSDLGMGSAQRSGGGVNVGASGRHENGQEAGAGRDGLQRGRTRGPLLLAGSLSEGGSESEEGVSDLELQGAGLQGYAREEDSEGEGGSSSFDSREFDVYAGEDGHAKQEGAGVHEAESRGGAQAGSSGRSSGRDAGGGKKGMAEMVEGGRKRSGQGGEGGGKTSEAKGEQQKQGQAAKRGLGVKKGETAAKGGKVPEKGQNKKEKRGKDLKALLNSRGNRLGQKARRALFEKLYGQEARHVREALVSVRTANFYF